MLRGRDGAEWMVVQGGLREEGFRDNETWVLGPLGAAAGAAAWRWFEVQEGGGAQSPERPSPRFHHTVSGVRGGAGLLVVGGHDHRIRPILQPWALSLGELAVALEACHVLGALALPPASRARDTGDVAAPAALERRRCERATPRQLPPSVGNGAPQRCLLPLQALPLRKLRLLALKLRCLRIGNLPVALHRRAGEQNELQRARRVGGGARACPVGACIGACVVGAVVGAVSSVPGRVLMASVPKPSVPRPLVPKPSGSALRRSWQFKQPSATQNLVQG